MTGRKLLYQFIVVAVCSSAVALVVYGQGSCHPPATPVIDYLGALSGCRPGGAPCVLGERIDFFARPATGGSFQACDTFAWTFGDGGTASIQNPSHTYLSIGNFSPSLRVSNPAGVSNGGSRVVVVETAPPVIDEFSVTPQHVAAGQQVTFTWRTRLVHRIRIDPLDYEDTRPTGTYSVTPTQTTSYTMTAFGDAGQAVGGPVQVEVAAPAPQKRHAARH